MAELNTVARPYAEAVHRVAKADGTTVQWSRVLSILAALSVHPEVVRLASGPAHGASALRTLGLNVVGEGINTAVDRFLATVLENRRFGVLPQIAALYEQLVLADQGSVDAAIESAFALSDQQKIDLCSALSRKFHRHVRATYTVAPELIGGVRMVVGDNVVDASVRGKLASLAAGLIS